MYCVNCGIKLADTENKCPLCNTEVYHPIIKQVKTTPLYPAKKMPPKSSVPKKLNGALIILLLIPLIICFFSDMQRDGNVDWFGFVAGAVLVGYVILALPAWFAKPNPVIFVPCGFVATILYILYIEIVVGGKWFLSFAFPTVGGVGLIICAVVTLLKYLKKGKLYVLGGAFAILGAFILLVEFLIDITFELTFLGWSIYPMVVLLILGGLLIYLAINRNAREMMERKLFF